MDIANSNEPRVPIEAIVATGAQDHAAPTSNESEGVAQDVEEKPRAPISNHHDKKEQDNQSYEKASKASDSSQSRSADLQTTKNSDVDSPPPYSRKWYQFYKPRHGAPPAPESLDDADILPLAKVNFLNELLYIWISPVIKLGRQRPLQVGHRQLKKKYFYVALV
jgi:hypothetical protein